MADTNNTPNRKVVVGVATGGLVAFASWLLSEFGHHTMSPEAAIGLSALLTFIVQYLVPNAEV